MANTLKATNGDIEEEVTQSIKENERKEENRSLENPQENSQTAENPELDKTKIEFHKALKEFEGTDPTIRYQIPKLKCSRKLATIITTINQEIFPNYMKNNVTNFIELHNIIYAAAVATVRMSGRKMRNKKRNHSQNKKQIQTRERRLKKQIEDLRKDIGRVKLAQRGKTSNRMKKHIRRMKKKVRVHAKHDPSNAHTTEILVTLKQNYLQSHKSSHGTKKQTKESNKIGFSTPTKEPTIVTPKMKDSLIAKTNCRINRS